MENKTKILFLGDRSVGKTSFLITYITNRFPEDFVPSTDENFEGNINFNGKELSLGFWDFGSRGDDPEGDRPLHYPGTECFVINNLMTFFHNRYRIFRTN